LATTSLRDWLAVQPVYAVRVEDQLFLRFEIIEHGHLLASDHAQLLFFKGVKPADKNVRVYSTLEVTSGQSSVWNL